MFHLHEIIIVKILDVVFFRNNVRPSIYEIFHWDINRFPVFKIQISTWRITFYGPLSGFYRLSPARTATCSLVAPKIRNTFRFL